jgi:hypothetical protein
LACIHGKCARTFISNRNSYRSLPEVLFASMEHLPRAMHELDLCSAYTASAINSVRPFRPVGFGISRAFVMLPEAMKCFGGHMAKIIEFYIPQSFHKVSKWLPSDERGKVLTFPQAVRKSA